MDIDKLLADEETVGSKETVFKETVSGETTGETAEVAAGTGGDASGKELATVGQKETKPKKRKGKPRGGNSPVIGNNGLMLEPGDNTKYLSLNMELFNMPDIDLHTVAGKNKHDDVPDSMAMLAEFAQSLTGAKVEVFQRPW